MLKRYKFFRAVLIATMAFFLTGCAARTAETMADDGDYIPVDFTDAHVNPQEPNDDTDNADDNPTTEHAAASPTEEPVTEIANDSGQINPNEIGDIMIIMYHGLMEEEDRPRYMCTADEFRNNLKEMYEMGFRLISLKDLVDNDISVEAGYTPLLLTFDDGLSTAFSLEERDGVLYPREDTALYILNEFSEAHPDFGNTAVFFINGNSNAFKGDGTLSDKYRYLIDNGYEIGNHTYAHSSLRKQDALGIQEQIGKMDQLIRSIIPDYESYGIAYPYGQRPIEELRHLALDGEYENIKYSYKWAIREGQSGASAAPNHINFDRLNVPRVRGTDNDPTDLGWQLRFYKENPSARYISDGDPNRISVPSSLADLVNMDSLGDKELYIYDMIDD